MIELEEPFLMLAAGSGKGITAELVFPVRITLERGKPGDLGVTYEFSKLFDASEFFESIPVSSLALARDGLVFFFMDAFKSLGLKVEHINVINHEQVYFMIRTDSFKLQPNFKLPDIVKHANQTLSR